MDLHKNFTAHRYLCILSKYTVVFPQWSFLSTKFDGFTILIGSNIFPLLVATLVPMCSYDTWPISLLPVGVSLRFFLLKISLISTYKVPPHLPCFLVRVLSNLTWNIQKFGSSPYWPPGQHTEFSYANEAVTSLPSQFKPCPWRPKMSESASMEKWQNFEFFPLIFQHSYQITSQKRWHPLATDKTFLQLKGFDKIPSDYREIWGNPCQFSP